MRSRRLAGQRHQHHAGRHALQPHLHAQLRQRGLAADLGNLSRRQRVSSQRRPRPEVTQGTKTQLPTATSNYINYAAYTFPPPRTATAILLSPFGNASRNPGRTPPFYETDLALNKRFSTPIESLKVEFRTEFYNIFNHTNFYLPGVSALLCAMHHLLAGQAGGFGWFMVKCL
jgi:hypothetical protein